MGEKLRKDGYLCASNVYVMKIYSQIWKLTVLLVSLMTSATEICGQLLPQYDKKDVVVYFDNDVHGVIDGYAQIAWLRDQTLQQTPNVLMVSMGDYAQGSIFCFDSHGEHIIDLMNTAGYDIAIPGNHEFDYGLKQLKMFSDRFKGNMVLCNFRNVRTGEDFFPQYAIREMGPHRIAFIGIVSPVTETNDSPQSYFDERGRRVYSFFTKGLSIRLQQTVDSVRSLGANMVVVMAHLGDNAYSRASSEEILRSTNGIDVMLDGHAHSVIPSRMVPNKDGQSVLLSSTGWKFENIGRLVIHPDGSCVTDLIATSSIEQTSKSVTLAIDALKKDMNTETVLGRTDYSLLAFEKSTNTYDRNMQTNLGDFCSDAFRISMKAEIGWLNAGGLRAGIPAGEITVGQLLTTFPFEDSACLALFTGQQILDALEYGVSRYPEDSGSFPQVSGLRYKIDPTIPSPVHQDELGVMLSIMPSKRRIYDVEVLDPRSGIYVPLRADRRYRVASFDYMLRYGGCGGSLSGGQIISEDEPLDIQIFEQFLRRLGGSVTSAYAKPQGRVRVHSRE